METERCMAQNKEIGAYCSLVKGHCDEHVAHPQHDYRLPVICSWYDRPTVYSPILDRLRASIVVNGAFLVASTATREQQLGMIADAAREVEALKASMANLSSEYHAAINEPEYAGTRKDWIWRAQKAEAALDEARAAITRLTAERDDYIAQCTPTEEPSGERFLLNAYGRKCWQLGYNERNKKLTSIAALSAPHAPKSEKQT